VLAACKDTRMRGSRIIELEHSRVAGLPQGSRSAGALLLLCIAARPPSCRQRRKACPMEKQQAEPYAGVAVPVNEAAPVAPVESEKQAEPNGSPLRDCLQPIRDILCCPVSIIYAIICCQVPSGL
jgi:hypothetical protein